MVRQKINELRDRVGGSFCKIMESNIVNITAFAIGLVAIVQDLRFRKFSNASVLWSFLILIAVLLYEKGFVGVVAGVPALFIVLFVGYLVWLGGVLGAGDVKIMAILAMTMDWTQSLEFVFYSFVWGGLVGLIGLVLDPAFFTEARVFSFHPILSIRTQRVRRHRIPFTVGIFFGLLTFWVLSSKGVHFL